MESDWPDLDLLAKEIEAASKETDSFYQEAENFLTLYGTLLKWYFIQDNYDENHNVLDCNVFPPVKLYLRSKQMCDAFLNGFIAPAEFQAFKKAADEIANSAQGMIALATDKSINVPEVLEAQIPHHVVQFIEKFVNDDGLVVGLSPLQRKILRAIQSDAAVCVQDLWDKSRREAELNL